MNGAASQPSSLDAIDYDPIHDLNAVFSHTSTLGSVNSVASSLQTYQNDLDISIADLVSAQVYRPDSSIQRMQSAKEELAQLFRKIETVRSRAIETEQTITNMTADIKRLDSTKRNLTLSMTALKRLQMLTTAYEQLRGLAKTRQYRECANLLQAVIQLMAHFKSYRSIDQIATLSRNVADLQRELLEQVCEDFELAFAKGETATKKAVLHEGCLVMEALGENARSRLVTWYCNTQLREYRAVFGFRGGSGGAGGDEAGSLDNIGRRYAWFKRLLKVYDDEHATIFPPGWRVNEVLANAFCEGTRDDFKGILERSTRRADGQTLDVNLLLSCLQETMDFEQGLEKRFSYARDRPRESIDTLSSLDDRPLTFNRSISEAFEPYLSLWVEAQDKQLAGSIIRYRVQSLLPADEEFTSQAVIQSSIELFHFYKLSLAQCAKLSTGDRLLDFSKILAKYLDEYAQQVLLYFLQRVAATSSGQGDAALQEIILVLNTADYWHTNTTSLTSTIQKLISPPLADKVDLSSQSDTFMGVASAAVLALVHRVQVRCEAPWREMRNMNWRGMEVAGDHSGYITELISAIDGGAAEILALVGKGQYARAVADHIVEQVSTSFLANIIQCKPISEVGAEQMLLDKYVLTKGLENLLSHSPTASSSTSAGYVKRLNTALARPDPLLKTLQVRPAPPEGLVQAYLIHIADRSEVNFRKILELKGVRRQDWSHLVELFGIFKEGKSGGGLAANSPLLTPLTMGANSTSSNFPPTPTLGASGPGQSSSGPSATGVAGLQTRFDPTTIGEKLFSAARDGVERFGNVQGAGGGAERGGSGFTMGGSDSSLDRSNTVNENLRNIGKFFRRDIGGLGGRFGASNN